MRVEVAGATHVGMKRGHNEDNFLLLEEQRLFAVADGMGGHAAGEVASKLALDEVAAFFQYTSGDADCTWPFKMERRRSYAENRLATGIQLANRSIYEQNHVDEEHPRDMGTTIVSVLVDDEAAYVAHVGDSRVYLWRDGALRQVTEDHSLMAQYLREGRLKPEEVAAFPYKNVILRALGMKGMVDVDVSRHAPQPGDTFLLCSDGLSGMVPDATIEQVLGAQPDLEKASQQLIDLANANGGTDNITCVLVRVAG